MTVVGSAQRDEPVRRRAVVSCGRRSASTPDPVHRAGHRHDQHPAGRQLVDQRLAACSSPRPRPAPGRTEPRRERPARPGAACCTRPTAVAGRDVGGTPLGQCRATARAEHRAGPGPPGRRAAPSSSRSRPRRRAPGAPDARRAGRASPRPCAAGSSSGPRRSATAGRRRPASGLARAGSRRRGTARMEGLDASWRPPASLLPRPPPGTMSACAARPCRRTYRRPRDRARPHRRLCRTVPGASTRTVVTACCTSSCRTPPRGSRSSRPAPAATTTCSPRCADLLPADDRWRHRHGSPATAAPT